MSDELISGIAGLAPGFHQLETETIKTDADQPFALAHTRTGESVAVLELPHPCTEFIKEVIDTADPSFPLKLDNGSDWTLIPMESPTQVIIADVYRVFKLLDQPARFMYQLQQRQDGLVQAVERLFSHQERILIHSVEELTQYLAFRRGKAKGWSPTIVKRPLLGKFGAFLPIPKGFLPDTGGEDDSC